MNSLIVCICWLTPQASCFVLFQFWNTIMFSRDIVGFANGLRPLCVNIVWCSRFQHFKMLRCWVGQEQFQYFLRCGQILASQRRMHLLSGRKTSFCIHDSQLCCAIMILATIYIAHFVLIYVCSITGTAMILPSRKLRETTLEPAITVERHTWRLLVTVFC